MALSNITFNSSSWQDSSMLPQADEDEDVLEVIPVVLDELDGGWFGRIWLSIVLVFGTFGNLMTITILRRLNTGWSAMNVYFTGLAVSDTLMLCSTAIPMWTRKILDFDVHITHVLACKGLIWMMNTSSGLSAWLLVALTAQRAASVVWPHRVNVMCTRRKSVVISVVIALTLGLLYSHTLYGYQIVQFQDGESARCSLAFQSYQTFWVDVWVRVDIFIYSLLPCVFLIASNAVLLWTLAESVKEASRTFSSQQEQRSSRQKTASSATLTIISVSTAFVLITLPLMVYNIFYYEYVSKDPDSKRFHFFLYDFFLVFCLVNFAWNFYLYCLTGTKFRREFLTILSGCCGRRSLPTSGSGGQAVEGRRQVSGVGTMLKNNTGTRESEDDF